MKRDLSEKGWVPLRYWVLWWSILGAALVVFYVLLTPIWLGLRGLAYLAEWRARAKRSSPAKALSRPNALDGAQERPQSRP